MRRSLRRAVADYFNDFSAFRGVSLIHTWKDYYSMDSGIKVHLNNKQIENNSKWALLSLSAEFL